MLAGINFKNRVIFLVGFMMAFGYALVCAQDQEEEPKEVKQYREDYERYQKVMAIQDSMKRADALFTLIRERPDSRVTPNAQVAYLQVVESYSKAEKYPVVISLCERLIKLRPQIGETYWFYGGALKNTNRIPEAMTALAKCTIIKNPASRRANDFLEYIYRSQNQGSLVGLEKIKKAAQQELNR